MGSYSTRQKKIVFTNFFNLQPFRNPLSDDVIYVWPLG